MIWFYTSFLFLIGIFVGSFLGVLSDRLPKNENPFSGRSRCDYCKHALGVLDLIPILSFLILKRKCRYCDHKLSFSYPIIELTTGALFASTIYYLPSTIYDLLFYLFIVSSLTVVFFADLKYGIIPDKIIFPAIIISFSYLLTTTPSSLIINSISAVGAFGFFVLISLVFYLLTKKQSLGGGDIKLSLLMGLVLGFPNIIIGIYLAFLTGASVSIILIMWGRKKFFKDTIPFGPFLVIGTLLALFWGDFILQNALTLLGLR